MTGVTADSPVGGRRRFVAPLREEVAAACFEHPLFAGMSGFTELLTSPLWPSIAALNERLSLAGLSLVEQDAALLDDGLHYEIRIGEHARLATRACNWHDLFNALVWARYPAIKRALNARQCREIAALGVAVRSRSQAALTQFDESGVIVRVRDADLLTAWDTHDWSRWFAAAAWQRGDVAVAAVVGHALMEQMLLPGRRLVGKCLVVVAEDDAAAIEAVAGAIAQGRALDDPLELRPLPLAGIPGWGTGVRLDDLADAAYFRPLRPGRVYPAPLPARQAS